MKVTSAGQNVAQAVQDSFDRGLIGQGAGRIQQTSISFFSASHNAGTYCAHLMYVLSNYRTCVCDPCRNQRNRCDRAARRRLPMLQSATQPPHPIFPGMPASIAPPHLKFHLEVFVFS